MSRISLFLLVVLCMFATGCSYAIGVNQPNALHGKQARNYEKSWESVEIVYLDDFSHDKPFAHIGKVAAHGNGYATTQTLENTLRKEGAKLGADIVVIVKQEVTRDETIMTYGGGLALADQIKRPHMYGMACVYSKVKIGLNYNDEGVIQYVESGSPADHAEIREGEKIVGINGKYFKSDPHLFSKARMGKKPGDSIRLEILDHNNNKRNITLAFASVDGYETNIQPQSPATKPLNESSVSNNYEIYKTTHHSKNTVQHTDAQEYLLSVFNDSFEIPRNHANVTTRLSIDNGIMTYIKHTELDGFKDTVKQSCDLKHLDSKRVDGAGNSITIWVIDEERKVTVTSLSKKYWAMNLDFDSDKYSTEQIVSSIRKLLASVRY